MELIIVGGLIEKKLTYFYHCPQFFFKFNGMKSLVLFTILLFPPCFSCCKSDLKADTLANARQVDSFWLALQQQSEEEAIESFNQAIEEAYENSDTLFMKDLLVKAKENYLPIPLWEVTYLFWHAHYLMRLEQYSEAAKIFAKTVERSEYHQIDRFLLSAGMEQGICLERSNQTTKAHAIFQQLETYLLDKGILEPKDSSFLFHIKYRIAYRAYAQDDYIKAIIEFQNALQLAKSARDTFNISNTLYYLIYLQEYIGEEKASKASRAELLELLDAQPSAHNKAEALSIRLKSSTSKEEALSFFKELKEMYEAGEISNFIRYLYEYATWLEENVSYSAAYPINQEIIAAYNTDCSQRTNYYYTRISILEYCLETKQYAKIPRQAHQVLRCIRPLEDLEAQMNLYQQLSKAHAGLQQLDSAYTYLRFANALRDSMEANKDTEKVLKSYLQNQFQQEKAILRLEQKKEKAAAAAKINQQRTFLTATITSLFLLAGLLLILYRNYQLKADTSRQLKKYSLELEQQNQRLDRFAHSISHDILSNLDLILSTGNILVGNNAHPKRLRQFYEETMVSVRQTKNYCLGLLQSVQKKNAKNGNDADEILDDVLGKNKLLIQKRGVLVERSPLPKVDMEKGDLAQIFQNLIENAIAFGNLQKDITIRIEAMEEQGLTKIGVSDNGPGIPQDQRKTIFEPGTSTRGINHGQGLSIVKRIVDEYGGKVWVEDSALGGAGFWIAIKNENG